MQSDLACLFLILDLIPKINVFDMQTVVVRHFEFIKSPISVVNEMQNLPIHPGGDMLFNKDFRQLGDVANNS